MTKEQAIAEMKKGKKITHHWFTDNEWMTMSNGKIQTEEGYNHPVQEFWRYRYDQSWNDGYSLFIED